MPTKEETIAQDLAATKEFLKKVPELRKPKKTTRAEADKLRAEAKKKQTPSP